MKSAHAAALDALPLGRLEDMLALGHGGAALGALDEMIDAFESALVGAQAEDGARAAAASREGTGFYTLIEDTVVAGAKAVALCVEEIVKPIAEPTPLPPIMPLAEPVAPPVAPTPPPAPPVVRVSKFAPYPGTTEAASKMKAGLQALRDDLAKLKVKARLPPTNHLNPKTPYGRERISQVHTSMHTMIEAMERLETKGITLGRKSLKMSFESTFEDNVMASAYPKKNLINVNTNSQAWRSRADLEEIERRSKAVGWHPTARVDATMIHELGHIHHFRTLDKMSGSELYPIRNRMNYYDPLPAHEEAIARQVSRYAATNTFEFIAETFTGMANGQRYSPEVIAMFKRYNGLLKVIP